jgi:tRNA A-37 threonylcarbamoyl transferase component Bud32
MKKLSKEGYLTLREGAKVIEADTHGDKLLLLTDGTYLKLFRVKRLLTSARFSPYSKRFSKNAKKLTKLGIRTVNVNQLYRIPSIRRTAVHYYLLPGTALRKLPDGIDLVLADKLGKFIRELHDKGVYFRSLNLGNIVLTPENKLGLIDISDMRVYGKTLPAKLRIRNFMHMSGYADDNPVTKKHYQSIVSGYFNKKNCCLTPDQMNNCF